ncbi:PASTA domain-containing protein [Nocardioides sp. SYSU DS0663]|uniref:PASTA domain-containing protein n=1 Tax=Nocardioides sp. SYSU DS0663 TaxID=3416445 RepID=UPI003F4B8E18
MTEPDADRHADHHGCHAGDHDGWARRLMHRAGESIEVAPSGPLREGRPGRRGTWQLAAVAAVVVAVAGSGLALSDRSQGPEPAGRGDRVPVVTPYTQVPQVFGHTRESAAELLEAGGLTVVEEGLARCDPPGRALATDPPAAAPVPDDGVVVLLHSEGYAALSCEDDMAARSEAWGVVDFLTGRGPAPIFAPTVTFVLDGETRTLTAEEAADPASYAPLPSRVTEALAQAPTGAQVSDLKLYLDARRTAHPAGRCGVTFSPSGKGREALEVVIDITTQGFYVGCSVDLAVYRDPRTGAVDTIEAAIRPDHTSGTNR